MSPPRPALPRLSGFASLRFKGRALRAVVATATGRVGMACAGLVLVTIVAGSLGRSAPNQVAVGSEYLPPSWSHPFGTDAYGRDELARFAAGGRTSLLAAALIVVIAMAVALVVGVTSGMLGGPVDAVLMRVDDAVLSIPTLVFAMGIVAALGPGLKNLVIALSVSYAAEFTRMVRAFTLSSRHRADIVAARLAGLGWGRVVIDHVVPDVGSQLLVVSTLSFGGVIVSLAGLSFLGLGAQVPTAEWGSMLTGSEVTFTSAPWLILAPGLGIVLSTLAVNLIADSLREKAVPAGRPSATSAGPSGLPSAQPAAPECLAIHGVSVRYANGTEALRGVSLRLAPQTITAVVGESGSGKSTLALATLGLLPHDATVTGSLRVGQREIIAAPDKDLLTVRGLSVGYVAQDPRGSFNPLRSVGSTVREAWTVHKVRPDGAAVVAALEGMGIDDAESRHRRRPGEWSGGMLQRASIVAANAHRPPVIVADEPTSALDADRADAILSTLPQTGAAVLLISHDLALIRTHSDRIAVLYAGRIVEEGTSESVLGHPRHPYTAALLAASPRLGAGLPVMLPGPPARLTAGSTGCSFAARCPRADLTCRDRDPELRQGVACWHPLAEGPTTDIAGSRRSVSVRRADPTAETGLPVARTEELAVGYGRAAHLHTVLSATSVAVHRGEIVGIQGPSGSGKSTLLRVLASVQRPSGGRIFYGGTAITNTVRNGYVMTIDQDTAGALDPRWPLWKIATEPLMARHRRPHPTAAKRREIARAELATVGLDHVDIEARPGQLSGGQRQRLAIVRALVGEPRLLVADEPTAALDVSVSAGILRLLAAAADRGVSIVVASHDRTSLQVLCDRVLELRPEGVHELPGERGQGSGH